MKLSDIAIKRPVTTVMMVLLVLLLGTIAFNMVNIDLFPDITYPGVAVITEYKGVGPEEVETMVTKPIEGAVATVTSLKSLSSTSSTGQSVVTAEFNWGTDMDVATMNMREKIDLIEGYLPDEVNDPVIVKFDPSMLPIMQFGVSADMDLAQLKRTLEDKIVPSLERLEGVAQIDLIGGKEREILITLNQSRMNNYQIDFANITSTLMMENLNLSGGEVTRGTADLLVRVTGKFNSIDEIKNIIIPTSGGSVPLKDIAQVKDTFKEMDSFSRLDGDNSIGMILRKQTDANTVAVSSRVREELDRVLSTLESELTVIPIMDQAEYIQDSIGNVGRNAAIGGLLAVIILFLFLKNIRSTIIIATAIPVSIITTFMLIYFGDLTINMMTLGGLALGVGMLVDNSIVVLENIYRYRTEGYNLLEAARLGSREIGMAIVASTLTTVVVFLPVLFMGGIAAELFKELALTVTFSLLASLVVSLTLIPVMSSKLLKVRKIKQEEKESGLLERIQNIYCSGLSWSLNHRILLLIISIIVLVGSVALFPFIGAEFIPEMDQGMFTIDVKMPVGTSLVETDKIIARIEQDVLAIPEVNSVLASIGSSDNIMGGSSSDSGSLFVQLKSLKDRERSTKEIMEELRRKIKIPGADISFALADLMGGGMMGGNPVSIKISGEDLEVLEETALNVRKELSQINGVREIKDSISEGRPEFQVSINRALAARFGLRPSQIASYIKTAISGNIATRYEVGGEEYDIRVKLDKKDITGPYDVKELLIPSPTGARVPLKRISTFQVERGPRKILREDQVRYVNVTAALYNTNLGEVMPVIQERIGSNIKLPDGYQLEYGGEYKEMQNAFINLLYAFLLAVILVYMVMASQFESLVYPFIVMFTVPMAVIGVMLGLYITGHNFSVVSIIGIVMLAGIVVNNAIVLIDYINNLRNRGMSVTEALLEAAPVRLRPILMTTLTTILGLLPLALGIGEGAEIQAPMAIVVIGGLSVATFLTLYLVPVLYSLMTGLGKRKKQTETETL